MSLVHPAQSFVLTAFAFATIAVSLSAAEPAVQKPSKTAKVKVTLGKETTYITEPLRADGYPDYVAAIDQGMGKGVTPQNNAAVLLQKAFGPKEIFEARRAKYFQQLGIEPLPDRGSYFVGRDEMVKQWKSANPKNAAMADEQFSEQFDRASEHPWTGKDLPMVAEWLRLNEKPLQLIVEATQRPNCYFPMLVGDDRLGLVIAAYIPHASQSREVAFALVARAMSAVHENRIEDAWRDLLTCHRLARQISDGFCLVECIVGIALDRIAGQGDVALAHYGKMSRAQFNKMQQDLDELPRLKEIWQVIGEGERMSYLSSTSAISRGGLQSLKGLLRVGKDSPSFIDTIDEKSIDWNVVFKIGNQWYDRSETAAKITDARQRRQACKQIEKEFGLTVKSSKDLSVSTKVGNVMASHLLPALSAAVEASDRCAMDHQMVKTAIALAAYREDTGNYPAELTAIVPKYLAQVPEDTFTTVPASISYRRDGNSYLLWSVHINGIDDNGASYDDDPAGDDLILRPEPDTAK